METRVRDDDKALVVLFWKQPRLRIKCIFIWKLLLHGIQQAAQTLLASQVLDTRKVVDALRGPQFAVPRLVNHAAINPGDAPVVIAFAVLPVEDVGNRLDLSTRFQLQKIR